MRLIVECVFQNVVLESPQNAEEGSIYYEQFCVRDTPFKLGKQSHYLLLGNLASFMFSQYCNIRYVYVRERIIDLKLKVLCIFKL